MVESSCPGCGERDEVIAELKAGVAELEKQIEELKAKLNVNSSNSSTPPSQDPPGVPKSKPKKSGRKRGAQPGHKGHPIRVLACDLSSPVLPIPQVAKSELQRPGTALIDTRSKAKFGVPQDRKKLLEHPVELTDRSIQLVGTFRMGADFANDGNLIMSSRNFAEYFPQRAGRADPLDVVDIGVVRVRPGTDLQDVKRQLRGLLPNDVTVVTKREFSRGEKQFWSL